MATEEELRDAQILKTVAETELAREQLRELQDRSHIVRRVAQGIGVGIVLALAGMALFGPIKDTIKAESELAKVNASIARQKNEKLKLRVEELDRQEQMNTEDLAQLSESLKEASEARDAAIARSEDLAKRETDVAKKLGRLAAKVQDNEELVAEADAAKERAKQLETEITNLREEAEADKEIAANVQKRVNVRSLSEFQIILGGKNTLVKGLINRLEELGLRYTKGFCAFSFNGITYYQNDEDTVQAVGLLAEFLTEIIPGIGKKFRDKPDKHQTLRVCA